MRKRRKNPANSRRHRPRAGRQRQLLPRSNQALRHNPLRAHRVNRQRKCRRVLQVNRRPVFRDNLLVHQELPAHLEFLLLEPASLQR